MKRIVKILSIVIVLFLLIATGVMTRKSFVKNEEGDIRKYNFLEAASNKIYYYDVKNIDDFFKETPIILKVKMGKNKERLNQCILSEVIVEEVYKNDAKENLEKEIYIYEPINIQHGDKSIYTTNSYIPMREGEEYIVFLKDLKVPEGYSKSEKEKISFMYMNPMYGKKSVKEKKYILKSDVENFKVEELDNYDVVINKENIEMYKKYIKKIDMEIISKKN